MTTIEPVKLGEVVPASRLVLGTMTFGDTVDESTADRMIGIAFEAGIQAIDTANVYSGGVAEDMLGRLLKDRHDKFILASKAGMPHPDCGGHSPLSPEGLRNAVEGSLRRLNVDTIDLFYLHQPDRATPLEATLSTVAKLASEGKIKALGVSNFSAWQIADLIGTAADVGAPRPAVAQQLYNLLARRLEEEYLEFATTHAISTMVYNPLAGGLLAGRLSFHSRPSKGRFGGSRVAEAYTKRYWVEELFGAVARLSGIAARSGITPAALALRWLAFRDGVGSVVLGSSKLEHLQDNIVAVSDGPLAPDVVDACDTIGAELRGPMPRTTGDVPQRFVGVEIIHQSLPEVKQQRYGSALHGYAPRRDCMIGIVEGPDLAGQLAAGPYGEGADRVTLNEAPGGQPVSFAVVETTAKGPHGHGGSLVSMPGPLADEQLAKFLSESPPAATELDVAAIRESMAKLALACSPGPEMAVRDLRVGKLAARLYSPVEVSTSIILYLHGGGWTVGNLESHERVCRRLAHGSGVMVLAVDYRLAPEHPWPASVEDSIAALRWVASGPVELGESPNAVAVVGDSAGGTLAALACLRLRDDSPEVMPDLQVLLYANTDLAGTKPSMDEKAAGWGLDANTVRFFRSQWVPDPERWSDPNVSPLYAPDLSRLPPTLIVTAEHDPLHDESEDYAHRLHDAGVEVELRREPGLIHNFMMLDEISPACAAASDRVAADLRARLGALRNLMPKSRPGARR